MKKVVTKEMADEFVKLYEQGYSTRQIAKIYGLEKTTISRWLKKQGVELRVKKTFNVTENMTKEFVKLYAQGLTTYEIARRFNIDQSTVYKHLKEKRPDLLRSNQKVTKEMEKCFIELFKKGNHPSEIAERYDLVEETVRRYLRKNGYQTRASPTEITEDMIDKFVELYQKGYSTCQIAEIFNISDVTVWRHLTTRGIKPRDSGSYRIKVPNLEPSEDLAYILGVIEGDGSVFHIKFENYSDHYIVQLKVTDKDFAEAFKKALENIGLTPILYLEPKYAKNRKNIWVVKANSKYFYEWYNSLDRYKDFEKILGNNEKLIGAFLRGFFDSEGSIGKRRNGTYTTPSAYNTDKKLIDFICKLLDKLGIKYTLGCDSRKFRQKPLWEIRLWKGSTKHSKGDYSNVQKFYEKVGFTIERKRRRLEAFFGLK